MKVILSHGKLGSPRSTKIQHLAEIARNMDCEATLVDDEGVVSPKVRLVRLLSHLQNGGEPVILVGSSMGGYTSLVASNHESCRARVSGLFLIAPALYLENYACQEFPRNDRPIEVIHGWRDETVAPENAIRFARESRARLTMLDDDHRLGNSIDEIGLRFSAFLNRIPSLEKDMTSPIHPSPSESVCG